MLSGLDNPIHLLFILVVAALVFGPKRLPALGRSVGTGIRELRDSLAGDADDGHDS
jgi:sec-independent protein translocase protein TatA